MGGIVPAGWYDREKAAWIPSENGRVIQIVALTNGYADLDTDGDGIADDATKLQALGITDAEREQLATLYSAGRSFWRTPITHFTPWDCNWPYGPPADATAPSIAPRTGDDVQPDSGDSNECKGCSIEAQSQTLGEEISLSGTPFELNYRSDRVAGRKSTYTIDIPLTGPSVPASLQRIDLKVTIAGQHLTESFTPAPHLTRTLTWDGRDAYGRKVAGQRNAEVRVDYVYQAVYYPPSTFGQAFAGFSGGAGGARFIAADRTANTVTLGRTWDKPLGPATHDASRLGHWSLDLHHAYDPAGRVFHGGDGSRRSVSARMNAVVQTLAGNGLLGFRGEGGPAVQASILGGPSHTGMALGPDGSLYLANHTRVLRLSPDGILTTFAGGGNPADGVGDGGQATQAKLYSANDVALGPDGAVFIAERSRDRVRRVDRTGIITTVAGNGTRGFRGDGGPATLAALNGLEAIAAGRDGSLYIADQWNHRVRRVGPEGRIETVAGNGEQWSAGDPSCRLGRQTCGDGGPATTATLGLVHNIDVGPDGSLYALTGAPGKIRRIGGDGIIRTVLDFGVVVSGQGLAIAADGTIYYSFFGLGGQVYRSTPEGHRSVFAGTGRRGFGGDGGPPAAATFEAIASVALDPQGRLYVFDGNNYRVRRIEPALPGFAPGEIVLSAEDGEVVYAFSPSGRHLRTVHGLNGAICHRLTRRPAHRAGPECRGLSRLGDQSRRGHPCDGVYPGGASDPLHRSQRAGQSLRVRCARSAYPRHQRQRGWLDTCAHE